MGFRWAVATAVCVLVLGAAPALGAQVAPLQVDQGTRTVSTGAFTVQWSTSDPEEITSLSWRGSPNLTHPWALSNCPSGGDHEFFGNSWDTQNDEDFRSLVGWGTAGTWTGAGASHVAIQSSDAGCYGTSGVPVSTSYQFINGADWFLVQRKFSFGSTPFTYDFRPYIPRLYPRDAYHMVAQPSSRGLQLVTEDAADCEYGCEVTDWNRTWFAVYDPDTGNGMVVRHIPSRFSAALWVDLDGGSQTTATSVALLQPAGGFTGTIVDLQSICFFSGWTPSLSLPQGCQGS